MKKVIVSLLAALAVAAITLPEQKAEAQVIITSNQCCDVYNTVRCTMPTMAPLGSYCWCYYQGAGHVC